MNFVASFYPQEHRTPPLPLVALLGCPELHRDISDYFIQHHRPPLVFHGSNEPLEQFVGRAFGPTKRSSVLAGPLPGILKIDWFAKHRGKKPAMAVALVSRRDLEGDPSTWTRMMVGLKLIADSTGQRGAGVLVAVVQQQGIGDLPPDRVQAVSHNLTLDRRLIIPLPILPPSGALPEDPAIRHVRDAALSRLGKLVLELATAYYSRLSRHVADKAAARRGGAGGPLPPELAARTAFKLAVYAEFRQDWATAVAHYRESYAAILAVQVGTPSRPHRWTEVCAVAELVHLKLVMLAVHQGRLEDAVAQVRAHLGHFSKPPGPLPPAAHSCHLGFLVRQHQVAAQEVGTHVDALPAYMPPPPQAQQQLSASGGGGPAGAGFTGSSTASVMTTPASVAGGGGGGVPSSLAMSQQLTGGNASMVVAGATGVAMSTGAVAAAAAASPTLKDCSRAHLLMAAARLAVARRQAADAMRSARGGGVSSGGAVGPLPGLDTAPVRRGLYVGQLVLRNEAAQGGYSPLSDQDYLLYVESEECRLATPANAIEVMNSALMMLKDCNGACRLRSQLGGMMAAEHVLANNLSAARKLLLQVCHQYRREGWLLPLLQALVSLREVAQRLRLPAEHVAFSLEIAALATQLQHTPPPRPPPSPRPRHHSAQATTRSPTPPAPLGAPRASGASVGAAASGAGLHSPPPPHPITGLTTGGALLGGGSLGSSSFPDLRAAAVAAVPSAAVQTAACASRVVDPAAAMAACRAAVATLLTGISEIKQGIMKTSPSTLAAAPAVSGTSVSGPTAAVAAGGYGSGALLDQTAAATPAEACTPLTGAVAVVSSVGLPRHFHYTVEHLDLREAQRRARDAGDPRPVADFLHRHSQQDYGWARCVALAAGFTYGRPDPDTVDFYLALYNQLPMELPLKALVLHFTDDQGDIWVQAQSGVLPPDKAPAQPLPQHLGAALDSATTSFHHLHLNAHLKPLTPRHQHHYDGYRQSQGGGSGGPGGSNVAGSGPGSRVSDPGSLRGASDGGGVERLPGQLHHTAGPPSTSTSPPATSPSSPALSSLPPHRWIHFSVRLAPRCLGPLRAERAILLLSDHATIVFKLASFPPATAASSQPGVLTGPLLATAPGAGSSLGGAALGSLLTDPRVNGAAADHAAAPFRSIRAATSGPAVSPGQLTINVAHLGPLPSLSYGLPAGLALLGEHAPLLAVLRVPPAGRPLIGASMEFVIGRTTGGLQPSDIVLVVDDTEGSRGLMALNNERYRIPLPPVQPRASHTVRLWARSAAAGTAAVAAVLLCPAQVTATALLTFEEPFEFKCKLSSEVGVHTLSLPRLSTRELGTTALTIGQPMMVTAMIRALQPATIELGGAQVALEPSAAIKLVSDPNQQLTAHGPNHPMRLSRGDMFTLLLPICPTELLEHGRSMGRLNLRWRRPAGHVLLPSMPPPPPSSSASKPVAATAKATVNGPPSVGAPGSNHPGGPQGQSQKQGVGSSSVGDGVGSEGSAGRGSGDGEGEGSVVAGTVDPLAEPCPDPWVTTVLELPRVTVSESLLTARTSGPAQITAGIAFTYTLQLQNFGSTPLELMISLMDSPGFACSNERSPPLTVPPRERASVAWTLVASTPGHQALPSVRLLAPRHNCALSTQSPHVYVQPF